ncbi:branched-chain amino acid transport system II carrier protein [Bifidobacterium scardovii]|uniref:Branched-chain amino acid transport system II carrier protein n=1 Tax=Bifidobacterium scardovii TaxID=158787 RepID=A0A087D3Q9_9BIFI|nr:branched-chain amino acid transport system II carrier protein [Bifidobacterium scardovii]KFI90159.1 branched-chain amino acid transport system II carrier protein [Bifidobacterium scardovii]MDK6350221.1 branched-chain amino acid transport system II carrier protein [Bifidobacterium scardovii]MDU8981369.1 branched-chain amino acid transport system II carrier protein [Bifidobacterium scardovii]BAQ31654.1 branched-chain amino acid transport protein [Bifidobacterium scardovii JCM 12489 = DSM 13734
MHGHRLTRHQRLLATVTFFSMFFGAGNLIFPPFLGVQAGSATVPAAAGFIVSAVGLPILGVLAVSAAGGFEQLANRVSPKFSLVLGVAIILTIGPCFAIPRTATTSFEMAVVPFTADAPRWLTQLVYSLVFFALSFVMAQHPERLSKTLGRFMGPLLLVLIAVLFAACLVIGHGAFTAPYGNYASGQLARGFLDGYQTMDLLAALYFGIVISANVREMGVTDESANRRETGLAGVGTGVMLIAVYGALSYVGMVSGAFATIDPAKDNGATVLTNLTASAFGPWGTAFVGLVFVVACFNVCTGLISTCGTYFQNRFPRVAGRRVSYRAWSAIFAVFSFIVSNAGLSTIVTVSVPVLAALYPIAIVLVVLALVHRPFSGRFPHMYFWTVLLVGIVSAVDCLDQLITVFTGLTVAPLHVVTLLPLYSAQLGWLLPAAIGLAIGVAVSLAKRTTAAAR